MEYCVFLAHFSLINLLYLYPSGLFFCQFHVSLHIFTSPRSAFQSRTLSALLASAQHSGRSSGHLGPNSCFTLIPLASSKAFTISVTLYGVPVPMLKTSVKQSFIMHLICTYTNANILLPNTEINICFWLLAPYQNLLL